MPVGFKNGTDGNIQVAVDGVRPRRPRTCSSGSTTSATASSSRPPATSTATSSCAAERVGPNYDDESVADAVAVLAKAGLPQRVMIDASHANSGKDHVRQAEVAVEIAEMVRGGAPISGVMLESFLEPGAQSPDSDDLVYGRSVTDKCIGWDATEDVLRALAR